MIQTQNNDVLKEVSVERHLKIGRYGTPDPQEKSLYCIE